MDDFENRFWSGGDLGDLYRAVDRDRETLRGAERHLSCRISASSRACARTQRSSPWPWWRVQASGDAGRDSVARLDTLESHLSFLATVGSTSPVCRPVRYGVGDHERLYQALGNVKQATLNLVAPGIAEALVATAMGLFAAIPAVVAYNKYANSVQRLENRYDDFRRGVFQHPAAPGTYPDPAAVIRMRYHGTQSAQRGTGITALMSAVATRPQETGAAPGAWLSGPGLSGPASAPCPLRFSVRPVSIESDLHGA